MQNEGMPGPYRSELTNPVVPALVPVRLQTPARIVYDPKEPLAHTKGPEPISMLFTTGSAPGPDRNDGSTVHCPVPLPDPGFEIDRSLHAPEEPTVFQRCCGTMGTLVMSNNAKELSAFNAT